MTGSQESRIIDYIAGRLDKVEATVGEARVESAADHADVKARLDRVEISQANVFNRLGSLERTAAANAARSEGRASVWHGWRLGLPVAVGTIAVGVAAADLAIRVI